MIKLTDEILNRYLDGELDNDTAQEIREVLNNSETERKRFLALQAVHQELGKIKKFEVSAGFTSNIMTKLLKKSKTRKKDRYFIFSISSVFILLCLSIVVYSFVMVIGQSTGTAVSNQSVNQFFDSIIKNLSSLRVIFTNQNISILGSIFSLGMIVIAYFFYENLKQTKQRLSKLH